jgi:spermidine synthase
MKIAPFVVAVFLASGCAALIYELAWFQSLAILLGGTTRGMALVLATFMAGMGLGAVLLPRRIGPSLHPLAACGLLEAFIAVSGLLVPELLQAVSRIPLSGPSADLARWLCSVAILLVPTMAMGATLPLAARLFAGSGDANRRLGSLYAANTAGAVLGCLLAGFYLLRFHDDRVATWTAAGLNAAAAVVAVAAAATHRVPASAGSGTTGPAMVGSADGPPPNPGPGVLIAIALSGATALAAEVVWTRLLALLLGGTVYTFSLVLAAVLVGIGVGAAGGAAAARGRRRSQFLLACCQIALVPAIAHGGWALGAWLPDWPVPASIVSSTAGRFAVDGARCLFVVLPAAMLWGASVPLAVAAVGAVRDPSRAAGTILAANTAGAIVGAVAAAIWLVPACGSRQTQRIIMATAAAAAIAALLPRRLAWRRIVTAPPAPARLALGALPVALLAALWGTIPPLSPTLVGYGRNAAAFRGREGEFLCVAEGTESCLAVSRGPAGYLNYHNAGKVQASSEPQDMRLQRMLGHLTTLVAARPRNVLVIGCGAGVTAGAVSIDPDVVRETIVEIEPIVPRAAGAHFDGLNNGVLRNPRVRVCIDDARRFLRNTPERFDAITSDPFDPWVKGAATLYTREFFAEARRHLEPGGVITVFVQLYESGRAAVKSEIATFLEVFPDGLVFGNSDRGEGYDIVLLGSVDPLVIDVDAIEERLARPDYAAVRDSLGEIGFFTATELLSTFAARGPQLAGWLADAEINRDRNLRLQYLAGLGIDAYEQAAIYREILAAGSWPEDLFKGRPERLATLRKLGRRPRY